MGCRCDYMESTNDEKFRKKTHELLAYVLRSKGLPVPDKVKKAANDYYGNGGYSSNEVTNKLCALIRSLTTDEMAEIVYDGRDTEARKLADWWDDHEKADKIRAIEEANDQRLKALAKVAAAKLTKEELEALRRSFKA